MAEDLGVLLWPMCFWLVAIPARCHGEKADNGEWHDQGVMHHALTPLLLSSDHTRTALPVLYAHPVVSHKVIPSFLRALTTPSRWITDQAKPSVLVRHLTIQSSPYTPLHTPDHSTRSVSVHPYLPQLFSNLPKLLTLHMKDTLVLHTSDANTLFSALRNITPKKARLEIRMWDLTDSPYGEDIIAATRTSIHSAMTRKPPVSSSILYRSLSDRQRIQNDQGRFAVQEAWRDALWKGVDLDLPAWWIEIPRSEGPGGGFGGGGTEGDLLPFRVVGRDV